MEWKNVVQVLLNLALSLAILPQQNNDALT